MDGTVSTAIAVAALRLMFFTFSGRQLPEEKALELLYADNAQKAVELQPCPVCGDTAPHHPEHALP